MSHLNDIKNPLAINLGRQKDLLLASLDAGSPYAALILRSSSQKEFLAILSELLAVPSLTLEIAKLFRPILIDLFARWLNVRENTEAQLVALCLLVEVHEELFPCVFFPFTLHLVFNRVITEYYMHFSLRPHLLPVP